MLKFAHIVAVSKNFCIGQQGKLPWHYKEDLKFFKETTAKHMVIMGRKTFESIGKPLPGRLNIVLSRSKMNVPEIRSFTDFPAACAFCSEQKNWPEKVFIIGGATLYAQTLEQVSEIYLTKISREISGDVFYPELNISNFQIEKMKTVQCEDASLEFFHYVKV